MPDGTPWVYRDWASQQDAGEINPAIVHNMRGKHLMVAARSGPVIAEPQTYTVDDFTAAHRREICLACEHSYGVGTITGKCRKIGPGSCARCVVSFVSAKVDRCPLKAWPG